MLEYFSGTFQGSDTTSVVIDVKGIGFRVFVPSRVLHTIPEKGAPIFLFTSFVIREYSHAIYGFFQKEDRDLFDALLNISGIGPKLALAILSTCSIVQFCNWIEAKDTTSLCAIPGVGKKSAERLIIECKDIAKKYSYVIEDKFSINSHEEDAILALVSLGFSRHDAQHRVREIVKKEPNLSADQIVALSFKKRTK